MPNKNRLAKVILAIALLPMLVLSTLLFGQSASTIGGTVADTSQAVLPNSTVTAINTATGISSSTATNNAGIYNFPSLQPGTYKVTVEAKGFQTANKTDVKLGMGNQLRLNFEMQVSGGNTQIEVSTSAENMMLEAGSSTGTVLQEESVSQLPLASNDVMDLINVMGGVVKAENPIFANSTQTFAGVAGGNINISRDGISVNEVRYSSGIVSPIRLNPEMVGEFKMVLSPVDAELGRGAGQVQILTKSGSNQFHGSGTWNVQNTALDANEWENKKEGVVPDWRNLNDYTISASGPIIKNKTFFFASWDQQIVRSKGIYKSPVLTPCARVGIYRYLDNLTNENTTALPVAAVPASIWAAGSPGSRPTVWGSGFADSTVISNTPGYDPTKVGFRPGDPLITYNGSNLPANFGSRTSNLEYESVLGQLTAGARNLINQDPYNCSAYAATFSGTTTGVTNPWDPTYRKAYDSSGYIKRFTNMMPTANDYTMGDGLNVADHAWNRELDGSDTVYGSGEDNERKSITAKIDHNINNANRLSGTYIFESDWGDDAFPTWPAPVGYGGAVDRHPQSFTVTLTSTLKPTLLNEARFGLSRTRTHTNDALNNPKTGDKMLALLQQLEPTSSFPNYPGYPLVIGPGGGSMQFATDTYSWSGSANASNPVGSRNNLPATWGGVDPRWSMSDTVTWTRGSHSFKGGYELRLQNSWQDSNGAAGFVASANTYPSVQGGVLSTSQLVAGTFSGTTSNPNTGFWTNMAGTDSGSSATGNYPGAYNLLEYVTGSVGNIRQYFYVNSKTATTWNDPSKGQLKQVVDLSNKEMSFFFKDDWKVSSSLTLNLGMRWEYYGVPYSNTGMAAALVGGPQSLFRGASFKSWQVPLTTATATPDITNQPLAQYQFVGPNSPNPDKSVWNSDLNNFAPHVGFAWQLPWFGKGKTTMRGGYSVSYSPVASYDTYGGVIGKVPGANYQYNWTGGGSGMPLYADMSTLPNIIPLVPPSTIQPLQARSDQNRTDAVTVYDQNIRNPYVQSLNLSITRNIGNNLTVDVRYIGTLSRKSIEGTNINAANMYSNGMFAALQTVRAGGDSPLIDALIPAGTLVAGPANGSNALRSGGWDSGLGIWYMAVGDFNTVINSLATTNGLLNAPTGTSGGVLRAGCLPSQMVNNVCTGHTPENFIYTNPQFASATINQNIGHSNYNSMQTQVTMRPTRGLSFQTTYTWSRSLSDQGQTDYRQGASREFYLDPMHRSHALTGYGTFDLPFGANGFIFRNATGTFKKAVEGWQLSWITTLTSGLPGSITNGGFGGPRLWGANNVQAVNSQLFNPKSGVVQWSNKATKGFYYGNNKYLQIVDPQCSNGNVVQQATFGLSFYCGYTGLGLAALAYDSNHNGTYDAGTDPIVFDNSLPGTKGNYSLNNLTGPGRWSLDMAMSKSIEFMEGKKIDFRVDATNIFNHATPSGTAASVWNARSTQVYNPNFAMSGAADTFGQILSKGNHRVFQAKIKISF